MTRTSPLTQRIRETEFAAVDFESTGIRAGGTELPVQVGVALLRGWQIEWDSGFSSYLASTEDPTPQATAVHGIEKEQLRDAPSLLDLWPELSRLLGGRMLVAHGAGTERRFLRAFPFHGFGPWVDTLKLARAVDPRQSSHALGDLAAAYGLEEELRSRIPGFRWHDAFSDAAASLLLLKYLVGVLDIMEDPADMLLRADDSPYHRSKAPRRSPLR